ncbi:unnamed protein product [Amoebophrya sp. A120]|nr:unnamed protein product [Amoebophrya sp. A120]|eukprot:GSA120T00022219001.1
MPGPAQSCSSECSPVGAVKLKGETTSGSRRSRSTSSSRSLRHTVQISNINWRPRHDKPYYADLQEVDIPRAGAERRRHRPGAHLQFDCRPGVVRRRARIFKPVA